MIRHFPVRSLDSSCLENVQQKILIHLHQQQCRLGCLLLVAISYIFHIISPYNMRQGIPGTTDCWNYLYEILTMRSTQGPAVESMTPVYEPYVNYINIYKLYILQNNAYAYRICSWLQDTAGPRDDHQPQTNYILQGRDIDLRLDRERRETGERFTPCSEMLRISRVWWCLM